MSKIDNNETRECTRKRCVSRKNHSHIREHYGAIVEWICEGRKQEDIAAMLQLSLSAFMVHFDTFKRDLYLTGSFPQIRDRASNILRHNYSLYKEMNEEIDKIKTNYIAKMESSRKLVTKRD